MQRRQFLAASLATSALALTRDLSAQTPPAAASSREFYQLRRYQLESGPQSRLTESYFGDALIPTLSRMGMGPVGAFKVDYGPETPTFYLVIPGSSVETLATLDLRLAEDEEFLKAADPYWNAPANAPAFRRIESSLLEAFQGWPKLTPPPAAATKGKRIYQLRTYESATNRDHTRKIEMFHSGEFEIFQRSGFQQVFFGDTLIGPKMPCLTYMLSLGSPAELEPKWAAFFGDPQWKKLAADPHFSFEPTVSNVTNLLLSPLSVSQV
ncbi:NIPSNAP family protein [Paracidobacterium acidisoli]|uniref:NIPSNAP family containing protein n=1 Tax=Paracidobacterium acidisoli TaxID=2303751 RepID=A0A372IMJ3_9BACT|nr:NIPSNAP family protein [Paracidobacterium acidisoli]MBT9331769.1 NIPSNAP family protein [Paracidobacterium acidisoli]